MSTTKTGSWSVSCKVFFHNEIRRVTLPLSGYVPLIESLRVLFDLQVPLNALRVRYATQGGASDKLLTSNEDLSHALTEAGEGPLKLSLEVIFPEEEPGDDFDDSLASVKLEQEVKRKELERIRGESNAIKESLQQRHLVPEAPFLDLYHYNHVDVEDQELQSQLEEKLMEMEIAESELILATMKKKVLKWKQRLKFESESGSDVDEKSSSSISSSQKRKSKGSTRLKKQEEDEKDPFDDAPIVDAEELLGKR